MFAVPCSFDELGLLGVVALELTAVKSQCFFMNTGMSENARKRWILICALEQKLVKGILHPTTGSLINTSTV